MDTPLIASSIFGQVHMFHPGKAEVLLRALGRSGGRAEALKALLQ